MMHGDGMWMSPGMWWTMRVPAVILLGALIAFGIWAVRRFGPPGAESDARRILEERLARGEIDADEFRSRLTALGDRRG
jgi:putative membrane protein